MKKRLGKRAKKELALVDGLARAIDRPELATILEGAPLTAQGGRILIMAVWGVISFALALKWFRWV